MRVRTPTTSAERAIEERSRLLAARQAKLRPPERAPGSPESPYSPLCWVGPLPPNHPLADTLAESFARRKRLQAEKTRRGL